MVPRTETIVRNRNGRLIAPHFTVLSNKETGGIARQFVLGVVQTADGLPLMHTVHPGNMAETKTLQAMLTTVLQRFAVQRVILVADRGLLSLDNIGELTAMADQRGRKLEFILAVPARRYADLVEDLQAAADRVQPQLGDALMRRVAVHEAAHVVAGHVIGLPAATLARISPRGGEVIRPHLTAMTEQDIRAMMAAILAGREAEDLIFGDVTSGGGAGFTSDLAQATSLGIRAECAWGFGASLYWISPDTPITLLPDAVRDRVEARLRAGQEEARAVISGHRDTVERIADALLELRELDAAALAELLAGVAPTTTKDSSDGF